MKNQLWKLTKMIHKQTGTVHFALKTWRPCSSCGVSSPILRVWGQEAALCQKAYVWVEDVSAKMEPSLIRTLQKQFGFWDVTPDGKQKCTCLACQTVFPDYNLFSNLFDLEGTPIINLVRGFEGQDSSKIVIVDEVSADELDALVRGVTEYE